MRWFAKYDGKVAKNSDSESGAVAILSVIFFMILLSVLVVSFVRIVTNEVQQTRDNELSASALAAAQGGVEDAKRVLVYCATTTDSDGKNACEKALNNTSDCNVVTGDSALTSRVPIVVEPRGDIFEGVIDDPSNQYQQRYSCLQISTLTSTIDDIVVNPGQSEIIPLKFAGDAGSPMTLNWHAVSNDLDQVPANKTTAYAPGSSGFLKDTQWMVANYPAVMRVELVTVPKGGFSLDDVASQDRAVTLVPYNNASTAAFDMNAVTANTQPNATVAPVRDASCQNTRSPFACTFKFSRGGGFDTANNDYYLKISATYRPTHIQLVAPKDAKFDNVQPSIDVTGRVNDAFRRVQARVRSNSQLTQFFPEYAVESGSKVCKNMFVTNDASTSTDKCTDYLNN